LNVDTNERPITDPSHQLPAHGSEPRQHKWLWIIIGIVLLLLLVLAAVYFWRRHENAEKKPAAPPKINITAATAQKGQHRGLP